MTPRLYPPIHAFPRDALADGVIGGYRIAAGNTVTICTYLIHRTPRPGDDPGVFDPDRFSPGHPPREQFAYLPFGIGGRKCTGADLAVSEGTLAIAMISQAFRVELADPAAGTPLPQLALRPNTIAVRLVPARRSATQSPAGASERRAAVMTDGSAAVVIGAGSAGPLTASRTRSRIRRAVDARPGLASPDR